MRKSKRSKRAKHKNHNSRQKTGRNPQKSTAPPRLSPQKSAQPPDTSFSIIAHLLRAMGFITVVSAALEGLKSAVELMPPINTLATYWLRTLELIWRPLSEFLGYRYFAETGTMMSCFLALVLICISAMILEARHVPAQRPSMVDWHQRVTTMLIAGSVATLTFAAIVELMVLQSGSLVVATTMRWWQWGMHVMALLMVPIVLVLFGWRRFLEIAAAGAACGILFSILAMPNALAALRDDETSVAKFRALLLEYVLTMLPWRIALLMGMAAPRFLLAQLTVAGGTVGIIVALSWVAAYKSSN